MKSLKQLLRPLAVLATCAAFLQAPVCALSSALHVDDKDKAADDDAKKEDEDQYFALVGGDVYTGTGAVLRGATILSKNGVIEDIGYNLYLPEETETLDVSGMRVYPGMVALNSTTRITSGSFFAEPDAEPDAEADPDAPMADPLEWDTHYGLDDGAFMGTDQDAGHVKEGEHGEDMGDEDSLETQATEAAITAFDPELASRINDSFDPFSSYLVLSLATGITTVDQSGAAVKLKRDEIKDVLMKEGNLVSLQWSINSPASIRTIREKFATTAAYLRDLRAWLALSSDERKETGQEKEPKKPRGTDTNVIKILTGEVSARFSANDREELLGIARFAQQYNFKPIIYGCIEGWTVAEELGRAGATAVVTPRARRPKQESLVRPGGSSIENAAILHAAGVQVAIIPASTNFSLGGMTGRDLLHLPTEAAFGVRGGLPEDAAFQAISLIPARILGVDHRVGTLEKGKDMDAIVMDGDVLHYETFVQWAVVAGKVAYDKQKELYFAHIRPRPEPAKPEPKAEAESDAKDEAEAAPAADSDDEATESEDSGDDEPKEEEGEQEEETEQQDGDGR